jgi:membrane dipeptidase
MRVESIPPGPRRSEARKHPPLDAEKRVLGMGEGMTRRDFVGSAVLGVGGTLLHAACPARAREPGPLEAGSHRLIWDNHSGFDPRPNYDLAHLEEWRRAGVDYLSIDVGYDVLPWTMAVQNLGSYITWLEKRPDKFVLVRSADDVVRAKQAGKMAITFDLEGMGALNGDAHLVSLYYRLGVRQMLIAYNRNNLAGGGCHDDDHGLTGFGREVIGEMERVGMVLDCSHSGHRSTMEAMKMSRHPVVFSHSNPKALRAHGRNITDDQIRACAATGGVVAINGIGLYLPVRKSTARAMIDCIVYVRGLVGVEHVGIGLDYSPQTTEQQIVDHPEFWPPAEYPPHWPMKDVGPEVLPELTAGLTAQGWSAADLDKLLGGNFLRVARAVWKS